MEKEHKILFINFGGIGDEILFLPTISAMRKKYQNSIITLALEGRSACIGDLTQDIDEIEIVDIKKKNKFLQLLKFALKSFFKRYDVVISSGSNKAIPFLLFLMFAKKRYGYDTGFWAKRLYTKAIPLNQNQYAANMYYSLVSDLVREEAELPKINLEEIQKIPDSILIHPGVSKMSIQKNIHKTPTADFWINLISKLLETGKKVFLAGGPDDDEIIRKIVSGLKEKDLIKNKNFVNLFGKTLNIKDLARRIKECQVMVCSDSAPMHIGVGVGVNVVALFGPTNEKKLLPANNEKFHPIVVDECSCRPCLWDKAQESCDKKTCLNFSAEKVLQAIETYFTLEKTV